MSKPSEEIEARSRKALQVKIDADPFDLLRLSQAARENLGLRLVVHEILVWLDEQAAKQEGKKEGEY